MSNEKEENSGWNKKKYLYLDKFTTHQEEDRVWKRDAMNLTSKIGQSIIIVGIIAVGAFAIAVAAFFK